MVRVCRPPWLGLPLVLPPVALGGLTPATDTADDECTGAKFRINELLVVVLMFCLFGNQQRLPLPLCDAAALAGDAQVGQEEGQGKGKGKVQVQDQGGFVDRSDRERAVRFLALTLLFPAFQFGLSASDARGRR